MIEIAAGFAVAWAAVEFIRSVIAMILNAFVRYPSVYRDVEIRDFGTFTVRAGDDHFVFFGEVLLDALTLSAVLVLAAVLLRMRNGDQASTRAFADAE